MRRNRIDVARGLAGLRDELFVGAERRRVVVALVEDGGQDHRRRPRGVSADPQLVRFAARLPRERPGLVQMSLRERERGADATRMQKIGPVLEVCVRARGQGGAGIVELFEPHLTERQPAVDPAAAGRALEQRVVNEARVGTEAAPPLLRDRDQRLHIGRAGREPAA